MLWPLPQRQRPMGTCHVTVALVAATLAVVVLDLCLRPVVAVSLHHKLSVLGQREGAQGEARGGVEKTGTDFVANKGGLNPAYAYDGVYQWHESDEDAQERKEPITSKSFAQKSSNKAGAHTRQGIDIIHVHESKAEDGVQTNHMRSVLIKQFLFLACVFLCSAGSEIK